MNSNVNVKVDSYSFINVKAITGGYVVIGNSVVDVFARGQYTVSGIYCAYKNNSSTSGRIVINNSKVDVYADAFAYVKDQFGDPYYMDAGIAGVTFEFGLDSQSYIHVKTNRASVLLSMFAHVQEKVNPVPNYTPTQIVLDDVKVEAAAYEINVGSYSGFSASEEPKQFQVKYEAMYIPETGYANYLTEILITEK